VVAGRRFDLADLEAIAGEIPGRRLWVAGPTGDGAGLQFVVETADPEARLDRALLDRLAEAHGVEIGIDLLPVGALYDRAELLQVGAVGKPRYVYTAEELSLGAHLQGRRES